MIFEMFVVALRKVTSEMYAPAFFSLLGGISHKLRDREHILTFPALRRIEDFVHYISLPESDDFLSFGQRLILSRDADISPHKSPQRICDVGCIEPGAVGVWNRVFYLQVSYVRGVRRDIL